MQAESETQTRSLVHTSPKLHGIANTIRLTGWITFWVQLTLVVVSGLALLFAATGRDFTDQPNTGLGLGIFWAIAGVIALLFSVYWDFRYTRIGRSLDNPNPSLHLSKADTTRAIRLGILVGLIGILLTLLGSGATLAVFIAKSISQPPGVAITDPNKIIRALDVFVMVANINGIAAHFIGAVASMWLLEKVHQN
jgi:amino acid transporter